MRLGLFGGSFDPIHAGHLAPVRHARKTLELDRVLYLPTAQPPHKSALSAQPTARYTMVELALLGEEGLYASPFEMRGETCFTVDTLEHFRRELPEAGLVLLIGADSWVSFNRWRRWRRILDLCELAVLVRPGWHVGELSPPFDAAHGSGRLHFLENEPWSVSSTELRRCLEHGENVPEGALHPLVLDYIEKYALYQNA